MANEYVSTIRSVTGLVDEIRREEAGRTAGSVPMHVAESAGMVPPPNKRAAETDILPGFFGMRETLKDRDRRDTAAWDALWAALDPKLRTKVQETARDLSEAEQALTGARAQLADLDDRKPSRAADVPKWAAKRGEVFGMISAYETLVHGARQAYEQAAKVALAQAQTIVAKQSTQALADHKDAEVEYRRLREVARQHLNNANEVRETVNRLSAKVNSGDVDLFR